MLPSENPKQLGLVTAKIGDEIAVGDEIISLIVLIQLLLSTTPTT